MDCFKAIGIDDNTPTKIVFCYAITRRSIVQNLFRCQ